MQSSKATAADVVNLSGADESSGLLGAASGLEFRV